jgi:hypothetical protein
MIEDRAGAVDVERRPEFLRRVGERDLFAIKLAVAVVE